MSNVTAQNVYVTKTGEKYHKKTCRYLKYSKKEIKLKEAVKFGYVACKVCKPIKKVTVNNNSSSSRSLESRKKTKSSSKTTATQCTGKTKSGARCKRKTKNANRRCFQH